MLSSSGAEAERRGDGGAGVRFMWSNALLPEQDVAPEHLFSVSPAGTLAPISEEIGSEQKRYLLLTSDFIESGGPVTMPWQFSPVQSAVETELIHLPSKTSASSVGLADYS